MTPRDRLTIFKALFDAWGWKVIGVFVASILFTGYVLCAGN